MAEPVPEKRPRRSFAIVAVIVTAGARDASWVRSRSGAEL
jgi:hypothetical protein